MARWSDVGEPDDPLRADDALVGAEHEDVLLGSGAPEDDEPAAGYADSSPADVDEHPMSVPAMDDRPTTELPPVVGPAPVPRGRLAGVAPWAVFAAVAVVVIAATSTWASWLQGPTAERQSFTGLIQPVQATTVAAPPTVEAAPAPTPEAEPEPEPEKQPVARPTQRPRVTRAPASPPPPAAALSAPTATDAKKQDGLAAKTSAPKTSTPGGPAVADSADKDTADKDSADKNTDKKKPDKADDEKGDAG